MSEKVDRFAHLRQPLNAASSIKKVVAIVSGKGGVGKSLVSTLAAVTMARHGFKVGLLDSDIFGPTIPHAFGLHGGADMSKQGLLPRETQLGIKVMSANLILPNENDSLLWRAPMVTQLLHQFWTNVNWGDLDYLFIDMPPGTGDTALTIFQSIPVDGIILVTSPQDVVQMIVSKAVTMAEKMDLQILGVVENFAYFHCPDNGKDYKIFGDNGLAERCAADGLDLLASLPIDPDIAEKVDLGKADELQVAAFENVGKRLASLLLEA